MDGEALLAEIESRLHELYAALASGENLTPAQRFRLEGLLEAAVLAGAASREELWSRVMNASVLTAGESPEEALDRPWDRADEFPALPIRGRRAPVYPSTRD